MAAALVRRLYGADLKVESGGLRAGDEVDLMAAVVMQEIGADIFDHQPRALADVRHDAFDLIVALSPDAWARVQPLARDGRAVDHWPVYDPTLEEGSRDRRLEAYRRTRDELEARILARLGSPAVSSPAT
jgi:protein-tyrosine-phosphatase